MTIFLILGLISSIFELTLLREFTFSIAKNELSFIVAIGIWLIFCSSASFLRTKKYFVSDSCLAVLFSLTFGVCISLAHLAKSFAVLNYYESVSLAFSLLSGLLIMAPVGLLTGYAFSQFSHNYLIEHKADKKAFGRFFAFEALGIFIGGVIFTFTLSRYNNPLSFCALPLLFMLAIKAGQKEKILVLGLLMLLSLVFSGAYPAILQDEFQGARIVSNEGSHYGPLVVTEKNNARSLYRNGSLVATSEDKETDEAFVHSIFSAKKEINNVLWIGPCFSSQAEEIKKYPLVSVTCVDVNPRPLNLPTFYSPSEKITYVVEDPRLFLTKNKKQYDLIVMNIPAPSTLSFNRFFTLQFFKEIKVRLAPEGIFAFSIPSKRDILSPSLKNFDSCVLNTLQKIFPNHFVIPSDSMIILGSQQPITAEELMKNFDEKNVRTSYFTRFHLKDALDKEKQDYINRILDKKIPVNTDLSPYAFVYYLLVEQTKFYPQLFVPVQPLKVNVLVISLIVIASLGFILRRKKNSLIASNAAIFGFLSIGFSAMIYFLFQLICGALFWKLGILVGLFMAGLSLGSFTLSQVIGKIEIKTRYLGWLFLLWLVFCLEMLFWANCRGYSFVFEIIWASLSLECGILTGLGYPLLASLWQKSQNIDSLKIAPFIYALDLAGAFLGTLLFSALFIPFLGIQLSLLILAFLIAVAGTNVLR